MISLSTKRTAERRRLDAYVAAQPSPARFRKLALTIRTNEPQKIREMRQGGFTLGVTLVGTLVLPIGTPRPQESKEIIEVQDLSGEYLSYDIIKVTPLLGESCYTVDLRVRQGKATRVAPPAA